MRGKHDRGINNIWDNSRVFASYNSFDMFHVRSDR